jgi:serine/threonine protein phosphatase PrpC
MHAHRGEYREDALFIDVGENHIMLCVADGAGSYEHSRIGSAIVCHELGNWLAPRIEKILNFSADDVDRVRHGVSQELVEGVRHVQTDLIEFAKSQKLDPSAKDFRCTLLVSILIKLPNGKLICISGQIGDGAIGYVTSKEFKILEHSASADFAGEVKCFFPDRNCVDVFTESMKKSSALPFVKDPVDLKMILLMTDGVADTFFPIQEQLQTIVSQLENGIASEAETAPDITYNRNHFPIKSVLKDAGELKKWLDFHKRGENDDRTLVVCWRND